MDAFGAAPVRSALEQGRPREAQHQQRHVAVHLGQVVQEVQRLAVGPVQVVELQHDGQVFAGADAAEELCGRVEGAVADLLGVFQDAADVPALLPLDADQVAQQVGVAFGQIRPVVVQE